MKSIHFTESHFKINKSTINQDAEGIILINKSGLIDIDITEVKQKLNYKVPVYKDKEHIEIHFELQGILNYISKFNRNIDILSGRYSFFYAPGIEGNLNFIPINKKRKAIGIELSREYLKSVFNDDIEFLGKFWENITQKKDDFYIQNAIISPYLKNILFQIQNCNYKGKLKSIYLQSKVNELLVNIISKKQENIYSYNILKNDIDKIYYASELIKKNFENPYSLNDLAKEIGMSESKLKRNFKTLFGTTVFQYLLQQRMQKAKELLLESKYNISEISDMVGYKNPTHFTFTFKGFYNCLPSDFKK